MACVHLFLRLWCALVLFLLFAPIGVLAAFSFNDSVDNTRWVGTTTRWYQLLYSDDSELLKGVPSRVNADLPKG